MDLTFLVRQFAGTIFGNRICLQSEIIALFNDSKHLSVEFQTKVRCYSQLQQCLKIAASIFPLQRTSLGSISI